MTAALGIWLALPIALVLVGFHLLAPRIRRLRFPGEAATVSFAGGVAASYVFLHLLPELAEGNQAVGELLEDRLDRLDPTPLTDLGIFLIALVGLLASTAWNASPVGGRTAIRRRRRACTASTSAPTSSTAR